MDAQIHLRPLILVLLQNFFCYQGTRVTIPEFTRSLIVLVIEFAAAIA
jgi:hypothetical protein